MRIAICRQREQMGVLQPLRALLYTIDLFRLNRLALFLGQLVSKTIFKWKKNINLWIFRAYFAASNNNK